MTKRYNNNNNNSNNNIGEENNNMEWKPNPLCVFYMQFYQQDIDIHLVSFITKEQVFFTEIGL